jgi:hypothetical protein
MCPDCKDKPCNVKEMPDGRLVCECGRHSWPSAAVYAEALRRRNLTVVKTVHTWTQGF